MGDAVTGMMMGRAALARGTVVAPLLAQCAGGNVRGFQGVAVWDPTSRALLRHVTAEYLTAALLPRCAVHCPAAPCWAGGLMEWVGARCAQSSRFRDKTCKELGTGCL